MIEKRMLGDCLYLYTNTAKPAADTLLITAHGGYVTDDNSWVHLPKAYTFVPMGTTLSFFSQHGESADGTVSLSLYLEAFKSVDQVREGARVCNYRLLKYQDDDDARVRACLSWPAAPNVDVVTVRNRWSNKFGTSLADVFAALRRNGRSYTEIRCSFCRSPPSEYLDEKARSLIRHLPFQGSGR
jgi:hypothetical protein